MEVFDWIANHWMYIAGGGLVLLFVVCFVTAIFKTAWGEWSRTIDTKRREPQKWRRDPFHKIR